MGHEGVEQHLTVHIAEIYSLFAFFFQTNKQKSWAKINMWRHTNKQSILFYLFFKKTEQPTIAFVQATGSYKKGLSCRIIIFPTR